MTQLVFIHGPGAGATPKSFRYQLEHFPGSLAPVLPGNPDGTACPSIERYVEWVRGWLWAQGHKRDLVLCGYTLGGYIALQYALDYPEEVKGIAIMTVAMRPKNLAEEVFASRLRAAASPAAFEVWLDSMRKLMGHITDPAFREELIASHRIVGPRAQHDALVVMEKFDVRDRIGGLKPKLLLLQGSDWQNAVAPGEWEGEIHRSVPGSQFVRLPHTGHFPMAEQPAAFNRTFEEFLATL
jgi:4,5:9,10-diseco-3-hydroxy-5,9,17-trioxoandrosta-1(10),2-diene-4-oate hydrolase